GRPVVGTPRLACGRRGLEPVCAACAGGEYGRCRRTTDGAIGSGPMIGYHPGVGGGWSRYFVAHVSQLHRPGQLPDEIAVLTDPFASALRPVLLHPPYRGGEDYHPARPGWMGDEPDTILVIGAGTIRVLTVNALR